MRLKYLLAIAVGIGSTVAPLLAQGRGGGRAGGFPQYTRPLASAEVLVRGKSLYDANCASCHNTDMRGVLEKNGPNLLRSTETFSDKQGELVGASLLKHDPVINLPQSDTLAIAEYIHSIQAQMSGQGSPPGRNPAGLTYDVLVGDATAGEAAFGKLCSSCHSVTGDIKGIGAKYDDPKTLQATWVAGRAGGFGVGRGGGGPQQATVTLANGQKLEGRLVRRDDFLVVLILADGTRKSIERDNGIPRVDVKDPQEAHKKMLLAMDDPENKNMHDITAYLATVK
jgi:cytochrome c oxidase cbb3-type subunit 3